MMLCKEKCRKLAKELFEGELTLRKSDFWVVALICTLLGVLIGLLKAPLTHGVTMVIGSNNGNHPGECPDEEDCGQ